MYPVLFHIGDNPVHSYYLLWTLALTLAVVFSRRRMTHSYGMDDDDARSVIIWAFLGMLLGARAGSVYDSWSIYSADPLKIFRIWEGGLSAVPAFLGAGVVSFVFSKRRKIPYWMIVDAAALPAALTVAVGRWGCFLNGCCTGIETTVPWALRFPSDVLGLLRHPTQLYYSFGALFIAAFLQWAESSWLGYRNDRRIGGAVLCPLFAILYSLLRLAVDPFRSDFARIGMQTNRALLLVVLGISMVWLGYSVYRGKNCIRS